MVIGFSILTAIRKITVIAAKIGSILNHPLREMGDPAPVSTLDLVFDGKTYPVPKKFVFEFLERRDLFHAKSYAVQSSIPLELFETFVDSLKTQKNVPITKQNVESLTLLANEFCLSELARECAAFSVPVDRFSSLSERIGKLEGWMSSLPNAHLSLEEEIGSQERGLEQLRLEVEALKTSLNGKVATVGSNLEELHRKFALLSGYVNTLRDSVGGQIDQLKLQTEAITRSLSGLEILRPELNQLKTALQQQGQDFARVEVNCGNLSGEIGQLKSATGRVRESIAGLEGLPSEVEQLKAAVDEIRRASKSRPPPPPEPIAARPPAASLTPVPTASPTPVTTAQQREPQDVVAFPMRGVKSMDGIISHLTKKHSGHVHEMGIVTITAKSVSYNSLKNVADLTSYASYSSVNEPGQWVCWDFGTMRITPTHYTLLAPGLKSWIVEASLDGHRWTEIHRQTNNEDFVRANAASFTCSELAESRFIRLIQTGKRHTGDYYLVLSAVEFFGTASALPLAQTSRQFPMVNMESPEGIIACLTAKHGGNVHEKGIVTITSKSSVDDPGHALKNVADLTSASDFWSRNEPGQWICWDFREIRVQPIRYTVSASYLRSWILEGSLDGMSWTRFDRQMDNRNFWGAKTASFPILTPGEFRFIRLTQTSKNHCGVDGLRVAAVDFFGAAHHIRSALPALRPPAPRSRLAVPTHMAKSLLLI
jgi:predicted  nucleic acid-binding Zn-ribbon protein